MDATCTILYMDKKRNNPIYFVLRFRIDSFPLADPFPLMDLFPPLIPFTLSDTFSRFDPFGLFIPFFDFDPFAFEDIFSGKFGWTDGGVIAGFRVCCRLSFGVVARGDGTRVGSLVGSRVGAFEGTIVAFVFGALVGRLVGLLVGTLVGALVNVVAKGPHPRDAAPSITAESNRSSPTSSTARVIVFVPTRVRELTVGK
jgi:hypothetical protein